MAMIVGMDFSDGFHNGRLAAVENDDNGSQTDADIREDRFNTTENLLGSLQVSHCITWI